MKIKTLALSALTTILLLSSCSIEKRHYTAGYSVQWNIGKGKTKNTLVNKEDRLATLELYKEKQGEENNPQTLTASIKKTPVILNNSHTKSVYETKATSKARMVYHASNNEKTTAVKVPVKTKAETKAVKKPAADGGGGSKSWILALLLCIFLGGLGIHRFYLGYVGIGILELLTGGLFGILWIIDLIRILFDDLKPKDGDYN